jgi:exonuclease SbcD
MKFIHTADWHLGNTMHDIDRTRETEAFLQWLKNEIEETNAQALVIAGDIFDVPNPSNSARNQYYRFLASLQGTSCTNVIVVGGNHDSGYMLDAPSEALKFLNVNIVGTIAGRNLDDLIFELNDDKGEAIGICCAVPFMRDLELEAFYRHLDLDESENLLKRLYADVYARAVEVRGNRAIPIVATGHLYAANLDGKNFDEEFKDDGVRDVVGTLGNVNVDTFPEQFDYVALGHIHYATKVAGNPKIRYSGSPFVMGFDEASHKRNILFVDLKQGNDADIQALDVPQAAIQYKQVKGNLESIKTQLRDLEKELIANPIETYVDVLLTENVLVNLESALEEVENNKHFVVVRHRIERITSSSAMPGKSGVESTKQFTKQEYFKRLIANGLGKNLESDEVNDTYNEFLGLFNEALEYVEQNQAESL